MDEIITLISSVGFPIAMCVYMIFTNNKTIENLRQTIENNTKVMVEISTKLGVLDEDK